MLEFNFLLPLKKSCYTNSKILYTVISGLLPSFKYSPHSYYTLIFEGKNILSKRTLILIIPSPRFLRFHIINMTAVGVG